MVSSDSTQAVPLAQAARKKIGLGKLSQVLPVIDDNPIVEKLKEYRKRGRPGYHPRPMFRAVLSKFLLGIRFTRGLVDRLQTSRRFRDICGFGDEVPSESSLSRFIARLSNHRDLVTQARVQAVNVVRHHLPDLGETMAIDSTSVESFSDKDRDPPTDPDARIGHKNSVKAFGKETTIPFFGYKMHMIADAEHGVPLSFTVTPGNQNDFVNLQEPVTKTLQEFPWLKPKYLLGDRGYDSKSNHRFLQRLGIAGIIHIRKPTAKDGLYDGIYDKTGRPTCLGQVPMRYVRTNKKTGEHLFRCKASGCALKDQGLVPNCQDQFWFDSEANPRVLGPVPRFTKLWKKLYNKRMSIERNFKSLKHSRGVEHHMVRRMEPMKLHLELAVLTFVATAAARLEGGDFKNFRRMRVTLG